MKRFASQAFYRMADEPVPAPAVTTPPTEPNAIKQMREQLSALETDLKAEKVARAAAEELITTAERAKLADNERLQLERDDARKKIDELSPLTERTKALEETFTRMYEDKINALPEDKRDQARQLSEIAATPEARFVALSNLESLIVPANVPKVVGGPNNVANPSVIQPTPVVTEPLAPKDWGKINFQATALEVSRDPERAAKLKFDLPNEQK